MTADVAAPPLQRRAPGPAPAGATGLARLLHPVDPADFVAAYWGRRPLHVSGWAGRHDGLFDLQTLRDALGRQREAGLSVRVSRDRAGGAPGADRHVSIDAGEVADALRGGASVCVDPVDRAVPALAALAEGLRRELHHAGAVSVKCYLSPDGYGFNTHFDAHVVTTLQVAGRKRWRISRRPAVDHPTDNAFLGGDDALHYMGRLPSGLRDWERADPADADLVDVVLEPGDVLCLPPGTWHDAKAIGTSLALNVAFEPVAVFDLVRRVVEERLEDDTGWRRGVPPTLGDGPGCPPDVAAALDAALARLRAVVADPSVPAALALAWQAAVDGAASPTRRRASGAVAAADRPAGPAVPAAARVLQCIVPVRDAAAAAHWYAAVLGLYPVGRVPEYGWVELGTDAGDATVGLTEADARPDDVPRLGVAVDDLDAVRSAVDRHGGTVEAAREVAGIASFLTVTDPDGNRVSVFRTAAAPARGAAPVPTPVSTGTEEEAR